MQDNEVTYGHILKVKITTVYESLLLLHLKGFHTAQHCLTKVFNVHNNILINNLLVSRPLQQFSQQSLCWEAGLLSELCPCPKEVEH